MTWISTTDPSLLTHLNSVMGITGDFCTIRLNCVNLTEHADLVVADYKYVLKYYLSFRNPGDGADDP